MNINSLSIKHLFTAIFLPLFAIGYGQTISSSVSGTWVENNPGGTGCPALALYPDNRPTLFALTTVGVSTTDYALYVLQQNILDTSTNEWENDYPVYNLNPREFVSNLSLTLDETGSAFVTWVESKHQYGEPSIVVGTRGGASEPYHFFRNDPSKDAFAVSSKLDKQGNPFVTWSEGFSEVKAARVQIEDTAYFYSVGVDYLLQSIYPRYPQREQDYSDTATYVQHWDGTTWQDVGAPLEGYSPILILNKQDVPYLSYVRTTADQPEVVVVYWNGQNWEQIGDVISSNPDRDHFSLVLDKDGMPIVALIELNNYEKTQLIVKKWDGSRWQRLGENSVVVAGYNPLDVSLDYRNDKLVVVTIEAKPRTFDFDPPQTLFVKEWNGENWQHLGAGEVASDAACPVIKLDDQGDPYVAWSQIVNDGRRDLYTTVRLSHFVRE